jgi:predicted dithiol-disulfide oxidoreductase (DUF899 family)
MDPRPQSALEIDHMTGILPHFASHDVTYVVIARAPIEELEAVRRRMDWPIRMVSAYGTDFNYDMSVSFRPDTMKAGRATYNFQSYPECLDKIGSRIRAISHLFCPFSIKLPRLIL